MMNSLHSVTTDDLILFGFLCAIGGCYATLFGSMFCNWYVARIARKAKEKVEEERYMQSVIEANRRGRLPWTNGAGLTSCGIKQKEKAGNVPASNLHV